MLFPKQICVESELCNWYLTEEAQHKCADWKVIKVAVTGETNLTSIDVEEHLQSVNNSIELRCLEEIEADKAIHYKVI